LKYLNIIGFEKSAIELIFTIYIKIHLTD